ncbi:MAG: DUF3276 family protein [Bacteroidetes bacterium]|nr:DUF3276 family protein [Bacteroidota bacterium]MBK8144573.1 DUF3276 family protein [Bacteroidota bacterium]MBP6314158.1 DUF3276 family protein [Chitinophagaceae bacterium]
MSYENNNERNNETFFSKRLKAGKIRTYFFDVRSTRSNDYFITLTESKKKYNEGGYERHKIFLYKEDFNKFLKALGETIDYVKTELMPDFDFDAFNHEYPEGEEGSYTHSAEAPVVDQPISADKSEVAPDPIENANHSDDSVDTW